MNNIISISDFRNNISDYINRVTYKKESFLLKKGKSIVAKVITYDKNKKQIKNTSVSRFAGILNDSEAEEIKRNMSKFRKSFQLLPE